MTASVHDGFVEVHRREDAPTVEEALDQLATKAVAGSDLLSGAAATLIREKFHRYLDFDFLAEDALGSYIDVHCLPALAKEVMAEGSSGPGLSAVERGPVADTRQ